MFSLNAFVLSILLTAKHENVLSFIFRCLDGYIFGLVFGSLIFHFNNNTFLYKPKYYYSCSETTTKLKNIKITTEEKTLHAVLADHTATDCDLTKQ